MTPPRPKRHEAVTSTKRSFLQAVAVLFPTLGRRSRSTADDLWRDLCAELSLEEIGDVVRPMDRAATRVAKAREDRPQAAART